MEVTVEDVLRLPTAHGCKLVAGKRGIRRTVRWFLGMLSPLIGPWVHGHEILFLYGVGMETNEASLLHLLEVSAAAGPETPDARVVSYEQLSAVSKLLYEVHDPAILRECFEPVLGPLLAYDAAHSADLLHTLSVFLEADGSLTHSAQRLFIHKNTMSYRLGHIGALLDLHLDQIRVRCELLTALRCSGSTRRCRVKRQKHPLCFGQQSQNIISDLCVQHNAIPLFCGMIP